MPSVQSRSSRRRTINEINMVPFIDVMLVLLIIFMVTAPLITPSLIDLPTVGRANRTPDTVVQVLVSREGAIELRAGTATRSVALQNLAAEVQRAQAGARDTPVVISADRAVKYESVVQVMDTLQRAGIARVGLSVQLSP